MAIWLKAGANGVASAKYERNAENIKVMAQ
jgi:hypothetical protein